MPIAARIPTIITTMINSTKVKDFLPGTEKIVTIFVYPLKGKIYLQQPDQLLDTTVTPEVFIYAY